MDMLDKLGVAPKRQLAVGGKITMAHKKDDSEVSPVGRYSSFQVKNIIADYVSGVPIRTLRANHEVSAERLYKILEVNNIPLRGGSPIKAVSKEDTTVFIKGAPEVDTESVEFTIEMDEDPMPNLVRTEYNATPMMKARFADVGEDRMKEWYLNDREGMRNEVSEALYGYRINTLYEWMKEYGLPKRSEYYRAQKLQAAQKIATEHAKKISSIASDCGKVEALEEASLPENFVTFKKFVPFSTPVEVVTVMIWLTAITLVAFYLILFRPF